MESRPNGIILAEISEACTSIRDGEQSPIHGSLQAVLQRHLLTIEFKLDQISSKLDKGLPRPAFDFPDGYELRKAAQVEVCLPPKPGEITTPPDAANAVDMVSVCTKSTTSDEGDDVPDDFGEDSMHSKKKKDLSEEELQKVRNVWGRCISPGTEESAGSRMSRESRRPSVGNAHAIAWRFVEASKTSKQQSVRQVSARKLQSYSFCLQRTRLLQLVHSFPFQIAVSLVIVLHSMYAGLATDAALKSRIDKEDEDAVWQIIENCFNSFFAIELVLRLYAERLLFVTGDGWRWNLFDSLLVILSILDILLSSDQLRNLTAARILRLLRFARIFRLARAIRLVHNFRIVVSTIWESTSSLFWCVLVIAFVIYCFTLFFLSGVIEHMKGTMNEESRLVLIMYYGSVLRAMTTLFMTITSGVDWRQAMLPLQDIHPLYEPMFNFYIAFMTFGVLNVVVGALVTTMSEINNRDKDYMIKRELSRLSVFSRDVEDLFQAADIDGSNSLSWQELRTHLRDPKVKAYFQALEFDVHQAHNLFRLLDVDGNDQVTLQEFLEGCIRLRGQARNIDVNLVLRNIDQLRKKLDTFCRDAEENLQDILLRQRVQTQVSGARMTRSGSMPVRSRMPARTWATSEAAMMAQSSQEAVATDVDEEVKRHISF